MATGREPEGTVYLQMADGKRYVMNTVTGSLTFVERPDWGEANEIWGSPVTSYDDLPDDVPLKGSPSGALKTSGIAYHHINDEDLREVFGGGDSLERYSAGLLRDPFTGSKQFNPNPVDASEGDALYRNRTGMEPGDTVYIKAGDGQRYIYNPTTRSLTRVAREDWGEADEIWGDPRRTYNALPDSVKLGGGVHPTSAKAINIANLEGARVNNDDLRATFGGGDSLEKYTAGLIKDPFRGSYRYNPAPGRAVEGDRIYNPTMFGDEGGSDALAYIRSVLKPYGLDTPELERLVDGLIKSGASNEEIFEQVRATEAWQERFKGNVIRRGKGLPELSAGQYVQMEEGLREVLTKAGVPAGFYDTSDDLADFIGKGVGPTLLADRVNRGVRQVVTARPEVLAELEELLPGEGIQAMLAWTLDPDRATDVIEQRLMQASAEGAFKHRGMDIYNPVRDELVTRAQAAGLSIDDVLSAADNSSDWLQSRIALFQESVGETDDLEAGVEGASATLLNDPTAARKLDDRLQRRLSAQGGAGGAGSTQSGLSL